MLYYSTVYSSLHVGTSSPYAFWFHALRIAPKLSGEGRGDLSQNVGPDLQSPETVILYPINARGETIEAHQEPWGYLVTQDTQPQHQQQHLPHPCVTWACPVLSQLPLRALCLWRGRLETFACLSFPGELADCLAREAWRGGSKQPLPQAKSHTRVFSGGSRPQFLLAKHHKVHGQEEGAQDQEHPQSIQDKAPYVKCTKRPENPEYPSWCSYTGCLGMQHPVAAGTSAPSSTH